MGEGAAKQSEMNLGLLPPLKKPYLDASVFLAHIKKEQNVVSEGRTRSEITTRIFEDARQGKYVIHTSFLTIAEVRRLKESGRELQADELPEVNKLFAEFLRHEWIMPIEVDREVAEKAQQLGAIYHVMPPDAIHLASAILTGCNVLLVWDKRSFSDKFAVGPIEGVHVLAPYWEGVRPVLPLASFSDEQPATRALEG